LAYAKKENEGMTSMQEPETKGTFFKGPEEKGIGPGLSTQRKGEKRQKTKEQKQHKRPVNMKKEGNKKTKGKKGHLVFQTLKKNQKGKKKRKRGRKVGKRMVEATHYAIQ